MNPVITCGIAQMRHRTRSWLSLAIIASVVAGALLAVLAGARRTDGAYRRFAARQRAADVTVLPAFTPGFASLDYSKVAKLPQVAASARLRGFSIGKSFFVVPGDPGYGRVVNVAKVLSGRLPRPDRPEEAAISFDFANSHHLRVGSHLALHFAASSAARPSSGDVAVTFRVVGVEVTPGELPPKIQGGYIDGHLSSAFAEAQGAELESFEMLAVRLRGGHADVVAFEAGLRSMAANMAIGDARGAEQAANVQRGIHLAAEALWLLGGFIGLASIVVLAQLLSRQSLLVADDNLTLRALGVTRTQLWLAGLIPVAATGVAAGGLAVVLALAASPLFPIGLARVAEPQPGLAVDPLVLATGAVAVAIAMVALAGWPLWRAASPAIEGGARLDPEQAHGLARAAASLSLPATASVGMTLALRKGHGRTAVPVRSSITAVALAVAALAAAVTFGASLNHLITAPHLYGWNWDVHISDNGEAGIAPIVPALRADARLEAIAIVNSGIPLRVGSADVAGFAIETVKGQIAPVVVKGRAPSRDDEVALGSRTIRDVGIHLGDQVPLSITAIELTRVPKHIVGTVVLPPVSDAGRLGVGAIITNAAVRSLVPPGFGAPPPSDAFVRFTPGTGRRRLLADLRSLAGAEYTIDTPHPPTDIVNFGRVQNLPLVLSGVLAILAGATLVHTFVSSVHRRRRDLAVLKILGFSPAQVWQAMAWQATTLASVALLSGLPVGIALGRLLWTALANELGTLSEPVTPVLALALIFPAGVVLANLAAAIPALVAARTNPASVLRSE